MITIPIQELINKSIKDKRTERDKDRKEIKSWHISKIGSCMRGMYLERLGKKPDEPIDDRTLRVFDVGNKTEDWIVDLIKAQPKVKIETQVRVEDEKLNVSGYADLLVEFEGQKKLYEIKSKHSRAFWYMEKKGEGANRQHEYQLWLYLHLLGIDEGSIVYVSKDDLTILEYPVLRNDKKIKGEVMEILETLNACWEFKKLPPLAEEGSWQAKFCKFHKQCLMAKDN